MAFYENWNNYRDGFGDLNSEFWLGNEKLHFITSQKDYQLQIDLWFENGGNGSEYLHYDLLRISSEATFYQIELGSFSGSYGMYLSIK